MDSRHFAAGPQAMLRQVCLTESKLGTAPGRSCKQPQQEQLEVSIARFRSDSGRPVVE